MECNAIISAQKYLNRFNNILCNMENEMLSQPVTNSITVNFIRCMIPHHQAAIYMSENLLKYTNYAPLREIAQGIIKMQTIGIMQMKEILRTTEGYINTQEEVRCYMSEYFKIVKTMVTKMKNSPRCKNINLNFVGEMIPHHEGALAMCHNLLQYEIDPRLKMVANNILEEQSRGVKELEEIRKKL